MSHHAGLMVGVAVASAAGSALVSWCSAVDTTPPATPGQAALGLEGKGSGKRISPSTPSQTRRGEAVRAPTPCPATQSAGTSPLVPSILLEDAQLSDDAPRGRRKYSEASSNGLTCSMPSSPCNAAAKQQQADSPQDAPACDLCHAEARPCDINAEPTTKVTFAPDSGNPCFHRCHPTSVCYHPQSGGRRVGWWVPLDVFGMVVSYLSHEEVVAASGVSSAWLSHAIDILSRVERQASQVLAVKKRRAARECLTKRRPGVKADSFEALLHVTAAGPANHLYRFTFIDTLREGLEERKRHDVTTASHDRGRALEALRGLRDTQDMLQRRNSAAADWVAECESSGGVRLR